VSPAGRQHHRLPELALKVPGDLPDRRRLACAVHANHQDHRGLRAKVNRQVPGPGHLGHDLGEPTGEVLPARQVAGSGFCLEPLDDPRGGGGPHVGVDEGLLETLPCLLVERLEHARLELSP